MFAALALHIALPALAPALMPADEGRRIVEEATRPAPDDGTTNEAKRRATRSKDPRAFMIGYARAAYLEGWDRDAIIALQYLRRHHGDANMIDPAIWQLIIVQLAASIGEHVQVNNQAKLLEQELDALHARDERRWREVADLTARFIVDYLASRPVGPGCHRFFDDPVDLYDYLPRLLVKIAGDAETRALALYFVGEVQVRSSGREAGTPWYRDAIDVAPLSVWAEKAARCLADTSREHRCGDDGAADAFPDELHREEVAAYLVAR